MRKLEDILLELLEEVDDACKAEGAVFFLAGKCAQKAVYDEFSNREILVPSVFMTFTDALKVVRKLEKNPNREIESLYTSDDYPTEAFSYHNTQTLDINLNTFNSYQCHGCHLEIRTLRSTRLKYHSLVAEYYERGYQLNAPHLEIKRNSSRTTRILHTVTKPGYIISASSYKNRMLKAIELSQDNINFNEKLFYRTNGWGRKSFEKGFFKNPLRVKLGNREYCVPRDLEQYFKIQYGINWRDDVSKKYEFSSHRIIDTALPYSEFLSNSRIKTLVQANINANQTQQEARKNVSIVEKPVNDAWYKVLRAGAYLTLKKDYSPLRDEIMALYKCEDYNSLTDYFSEYGRIVSETAKHNLSVWFDKDIHNTFLSVLRHAGDTDYANYLERLFDEDPWKPM